MMSRRVDLIHSFLSLVSIATFWCVVYAQSDTNGPCNTCPIECIGRECARYWSTSVWGFIVTLLALTVDVWAAVKSMSKYFIIHVAITFLGSALNPLIIPVIMLRHTMNSMAMLANLRGALGNDVIAPWYPWSKSLIKIILGCDVIVNLSPDVHKEIHKLNAFKDKVEVENLSEALVIGTKVATSKQSDNVELTPRGHLALMRSNVLPPYDQLRILRGHSSWGMAIASAQAIGYIYGVVVRCVQGLQVSPIEAIACVLNMAILMKGILHNFASLGQRPLLLYLLLEEEAKFIEECKKVNNFKFKFEGRFKLAVSIACGILLAVGVYFIIDFLKSLNIACIVPIILFVVSLFLGGIQGLTIRTGDFTSSTIYIMIPIVLLNLEGYVWAVVVTLMYWKGEEFDVRSSNYLSHVLPYIG